MDVPVAKKHKMETGRILETVEPPVEFESRTEVGEVWVQGEGEKVKVFPREYTETTEEPPTPKYLVTDPCYVVPNEEWENFLEKTNYGESLDRWEIAGIGTIISCGATYMGDGTWDVDFDKQISADAGLVCIVKLVENPNLAAWMGNAITDYLPSAEDWMNIVQSGRNENDPMMELLDDSQGN